MHRPPSMPREQARKAEETGIYLLKTPMVPKISMEETIIRTDLRPFVLLLILSPAFLFLCLISRQHGYINACSRLHVKFLFC